MRHIKFILSLFILLFLVSILAACGGATEVDPSPLPATETSLPSPTPTPLPTPTRTPAPTARPLVGDTVKDGVYRNSIQGVAFEYPANWGVSIQPQNGLDFVMVNSPDLPVTVMLEIFFITEEDDYESISEETLGLLPDFLGITSGTTTTIYPDFKLADGREAWRGIVEGSIPETDTPLIIEIVASQRGNFMFSMVTIANIVDFPILEATLEEIKESFQVFSPSPYGVTREGALFLSASEPTSLDPAKWHFGADSILGDLFSGLVKLTTDMQVIPDLAETWTVSPDGKVYTFHLRHGVTFHNGKPFTAGDVKYSWERACDPDTESDTAETYLGDIVGVAEVISGDEEEISGVKVIDDHTLEVTLDQPKAYFPYKLAYVTSWVVDSETIDEIEEAPNGTGPFKMVQRDEEELMILARNENYYRNFVSLEYIVYLIYQGYPVRLYESGDIDMVYVDEELVERAEDPGDPLYGNVQSVLELCTYYVSFDVTQPPFDELEVREAFAKAVDKDRYNDVVYEGKGVIANGLYPPGLPGYNPEVEPIPLDQEQAQAALAASSYGGPEGLPEIVLTSSGEGGDLSTTDAILIQMWEEVLGVSITVELIDYESYWDEIHAGNHGQIITVGWCADYPDPENFADFIFHTGSEQNFSGYSNPELDTLLEDARSMTDIEARLALYQEIEQTIIDDMPVVFLAHSRPYYLVTKPYVNGYQTSPIGVAQMMNVSILRDE
jgi:oligopeptide transport system substrate-binding protein